MTAGMRLLLLTDAVGGVWIYSLELARALKRHGVETVLAVLGPSPTRKQYEQASSFKLIDTGLPLDWLAIGAHELRRAGEAIARLVEREPIDIVQSCSAALLAHADFGCPCVVVQHSCTATWWATVRQVPLPPEFEWRRELVEAGLNRAAAIVAPSIAFAAETSRLYDLRGSVLAVHNGRQGDGSPMLPSGDFALTASRLWDEGKNATTLDAAAARLDVPFEAAGPVHGPNGASASFEHLHILGEVSQRRLRALRAARPIFASAAVYEPFGLSALEAAHSGCALVLSDIPTHREIWGEAAIFVPAHDDRAFASAIQDLLEHSEERRELEQLARARAQLYTPERMARQMVDIYARIYHQRTAIRGAQLAGAA